MKESKMMQGVILQVCAEYQCAAESHKDIWGTTLSPENFISKQMAKVCLSLATGKFSLEDFLFMARLYGVFLTCYVPPPTEEELFLYNMKEVPKPNIAKALLCVARVGNLQELDMPLETGSEHSGDA